MNGPDDHRFIVLMREKPGVAFYAWCYGAKAARRAAAKHAAKMLSIGALTRAITEEEIAIVRETTTQIDVRFPADALGKVGS